MKRRIAAALAALLVITGCAGITRNKAVTVCAEDSAEYDVSGDGKLDIEDVVLTLLYINGETLLGGDMLKRADINHDGAVDIVDAVTMLGLINGVYEEPPKEPDTSSAGSSSEANDAQSKAEAADSEPEKEENIMTITVNGAEYTAHFCDTAAAEEFKAILPLTLDMSELNGNEKYAYLDTGFSAASEKVGHINKGDLMLYGSNCVVLFYESFSTPYSYTRIGCIDDPDGLENAVGSGSATVVFSAK